MACSLLVTSRGRLDNSLICIPVFTQLYTANLTSQMTCLYALLCRRRGATPTARGLPASTCAAPAHALLLCRQLAPACALAAPSPPSWSRVCATAALLRTWCYSLAGSAALGSAFTLTRLLRSRAAALKVSVPSTTHAAGVCWCSGCCSIWRLPPSARLPAG
jgi:hypothetical protein